MSKAEENLRNGQNEEILLSTTAKYFENFENVALAEVVKRSFYNQDKSFEKMLSKFINDPRKQKISLEEALVKLIPWNSTAAVYRDMKKFFTLLPCYDLLMRAKSLAYLSRIHYGERSCEISLKTMMYHTASRIALIADLKVQNNDNNDSEYDLLKLV